MNRLIGNLTLLGLATFALMSGRAAAQHHGGHNVHRPGPVHMSGGGAHHYGPAPFHQPALAGSSFHAPQYTMPSYQASSLAGQHPFHGMVQPAHSGTTVTLPAAASKHLSAALSTTGSSGKTVSLKRPPSAGTASLAASSAGTTVSLKRPPSKGAGELSMSSKKPTGLAKLPGSGQAALGSFKKMLSSGALRLTNNDRSLNQAEIQAITDFLNSPQSSSLTPAEGAVLVEIANGQPLNPQDQAIAINMLGKPGLPPAVAASIAQGVLDNLGNSNPGALANNPVPGGILGALGQILQSLPGGGAAGNSGGGGLASSDPGVGSGPIFDAPVSSAGTVTGPIVQDNSSPSADDGAAQPVTPVTANTDALAASAPAVSQFRRYLQVKNTSTSKLTVYVQYSAFMDNGTFQWFPAQPGGDQAVAFTIAPGATVDVDHDGWRVKGDRVRIWAVADDGTEVTDYRDQDLWLVAEQNGERAYDAPEIGVFTFTFGG